MTKNLKKVISAVAALAISASAVSAFAVTFTDVDPDASYAKAVQEISALGIIEGFGDGTFGPDQLVTRAQITKMIIEALNEGAQAEASKANSQFNDVTGDYWAKGYINQGVADKFINGYSATEFGPEDNVTYLQAQKMLVSAIGYETHAQGNGGWPNGYKQWAASTGITDGISGLNDDTQLTRAQVAVLIDNAMNAPVCVVDGWDPQWNGTQIPVLAVRNKHDGNDATDYQTLFTLKHKAYKVYGRVTKTNKTDSGALDADQVEFQVEKADNFDDIYITSKDDPEVETMYVGETDAADYLLTYAEALIQKDTSNDEFTILSISAAAANKAVTLAAEDFDYDKSEKNENKLYFYPAGSSRNSVKYAIDPEDDNYVVYVNGKQDSNLNDYAALVEYINSHDTASVTLQKQTKQGSTSTTTDYNLISISTYETAVVDEVIEKANTITIMFEEYSSNIGRSRMDLKLDDENFTYEFTLDDGTVIEPSALQQYDVLSIAYDQAEEGKFEDSDYYDVIVSRTVLDDVKSTNITNADELKDVEYTFDGTKYRAAAGMEENLDIELSNTYTVYLDHFGRIAMVDESSVTKNLGILKNIYKRRGGDWVAQIIDKNGVPSEHKIEGTNLTYGQTILDTTSEDGIEYNNDQVAKYVNQVIEYSISSTSDKVTIKNNGDALGGTASADTVAAPAKAEYKANNGRIGSVRVSDASVILDISEADDDEIKVVSLSGLTDGAEYAAVGYDKSSNGDYHRLVLLTSEADDFGSDTQLAVVRSWERVSEDGEDKTALNVFVKNDETRITVADDITFNGANASASQAETLKEGDVILFTTNSSDKISRIKTVINSGALANNDYEGFRDDILNGENPLTSTDEQFNDMLSDSNSDDIHIYFGAVVNRNGNNIVLSTVHDFSGNTDEDGKNGPKKGAAYDGDYAQDINIKDAVIYTYDFAANTKKGNSKVLLDNGIQSTPKVKAVTQTIDNIDVLDLEDSSVYDDIVFAVVRTDDDDAQEIVLIINED